MNLDIQATIECGFTLKRVRDMIRTYSSNYFCIINGISRSEVINLMQNTDLTKKSETL